ncbi:HAMP domain-containing sensor histidine kinase [Methylomarinum sp. Ch1-1]|uniref:histidine kinase n=1 Tax=Methylomarinum roseum TaxID=3067653 RepID=A0AAU7NUD8_9GAMM|nr:HAMP domain-containing sensor histidine kinase [Methylomarinum sp. Ch1-1]MDP4519308.1 HAMP domain-containing sensor histidine kinase [Methylomarinum sp. Ch1-1]
MPRNTKQHFSTILASTVHDIKNSLGILQDRIHHIAASRQHNDPDFMQLEFEANRMNHSMMQLLALYKIDNDKFNLDIDEYPLQDILDEVQAQQAPLLKMNDIKLTVQCPDELMSFCDYTHISNALGTIFNNSQRYSLSQVALSADQHGDYVCLTIEDDGAGYPDELLSIDPTDHEQMDWVSGSTGLGLYFVATIASLHQNGDKQGYIRIDNQSRLGGARFRLFLP